MRHAVGAGRKRARRINCSQRDPKQRPYRLRRGFLLILLGIGNGLAPFEK